MLKSACNYASWIQGELCEGKTDIITPDKGWVESPANTETGRSHLICDLNIMNIFREMNEDYITKSNISAQKNNFCCKFKAPKMRIVDEEDFFPFSWLFIFNWKSWSGDYSCGKMIRLVLI